MTAIIDYGMGNIGSISNMLKKIGEPSIITSDMTTIEMSDRIILPGVGAFDHAIKNLHDLDLFSPLKNLVLEKEKPILGICLGMQLLTIGSDEGSADGFGFINAYANKFASSDKNLKIPHMGWNTLSLKKESSLFQDSMEEQRFYFVHSYAIQCSISTDILSTTHYGIDFVSSFENKNIVGVQFHPEKSHRFGIHFLKNFVEHF